MSKYDHPAWKKQQPSYEQPDLWGNVKPQSKRHYSSYDKTSEESYYPKDDPTGTALLKSTEKFVHELETIKAVLTAILNTLDEQKELLADHTDMLEELTDLLLGDEE